MDQAYLSYQSSYIDKCIAKGRDKIYEKMNKLIDLSLMQSILDVGVTADKQHCHSNFFENKYPYPDRITALSDQDASWIEQAIPGIHFAQGDGKSLPFSDSQFDFVFSSAVLEHVGNIQEQKKFLAEAYRVSKKYVLITTPNRWYPIEFHSLLPVFHWLPKKYFYAVLKCLGKKELADENRLNLCSSKSIRKMLKELGIGKYKIMYSYFLGLPSNILLFIEKEI